MDALYEKTSYTVPINYISGYIREFDIKKANISVLYKAGVIDQATYIRLYNADRMTRQVEIGLMQKNNSNITTILKNGIIEAKRNFFQANNIDNNCVLSIKNDAVFLLNAIPTVTVFDGIEFVHKNTYTAFYKLANKEYYYLFDPIKQIEKLDIKGMNDNVLSLHQNYFLEFLLTIFNSAQTEPIEDTIDLLKGFHSSYINRELDIGYYRRFDGESRYEFLPMSRYCSFKAMDIPEEYKPLLDISYNLNILTQLVKIYSGIYFQTTRGKVTY